ncbi:uncharacterized protein LOC123210183 [Mangifera indica]|uniref:uncharacterized protein LOC123210183 n=1 Tax=Mangifera indica TaxID=29780 RepID=UPI001CF97112|nr:uncharacterized protein LOC123210183 [Mangifera indica]
MPVAQAATLNHISRESSDIRRLANFYKEIFGFGETEAPDFGEFKVIWLNLPGAFAFTLSREAPSPSFQKVPTAPRHPSLTLAISPEGKGIQTFQRSLPNGKVKQIFFFDPDGNGLEVASKSNE